MNSPRAKLSKRASVTDALARAAVRAAAATTAPKALELLEPRQLLSGGGHHHHKHPATNTAQVASHATPLQSSPQAARPAGLASPAGLTPAQLRHAYGVDNITFGGSIPGNGAGMTIAIVDAYHNPSIAADLHAFDLAFGLPDPPSFTQVAQDGSTNFPQTDPGGPNLNSWNMETDLDVQAAHALAPAANILLVEANSTDFSDLIDAAVNYARNQPGVVAVSMSWGGQEWLSEAGDEDGFFTTPAGHAPVAFFAATGDKGKVQPMYPSFSPNVVAVGGTTLTLDGSNNYKTEIGWTASGGGISGVETQPQYQKNVVTQSTTKRTVPDVSFDADPTPPLPPDTGGGMAVYDTWDTGGTPGPWVTVGGTSLGAPAWAALTAIADQGRALAGLPPLGGAASLLPRLYGLPASDFHDIITGNNGYAAGVGYDLVTGRGSPIANLLVPDLVSAGPLAIQQGTPGSTGSVSSVQFSFTQAMDTSSFSLGTGISSFTGPGGVNLAGQITGFTWVDPYTLRVNFNPQSAGGTYTLRITSQVRSAAGAFMDQNGNFIPGESRDGAASSFVVLASVAGRYVFYNHSAYDGNNAAANAADDAAIAPNKTALLPLQTATSANYTAYDKGINGIMIDVNGLANAAGLSASDFIIKVGNGGSPGTWAAGPAPSVSVRSGAGAGGSARVTLTWPDGSIVNQWVQVTVKATTNTGLPAPDVFYFGNLVGDVGDNNGDANALVSATDIAAVRSVPGVPVTIATAADFNKDGVIDATDKSIVRANTTHTLALFTAPAPPPASDAGSDAGGGSTSAASTTATTTTTATTGSQPGAPLTASTKTPPPRRRRHPRGPRGAHSAFSTLAGPASSGLTDGPLVGAADGRCRAGLFRA